jgi:sugar phosphate isomerase/epimerase
LAPPAGFRRRLPQLDARRIRVRIAVQTRCLAQPLKQALHAAGRLGCDGVQIDARTEVRPNDLSDTGLRQLRKMLDDLNLRVGSVAFATRRGYANPVDLQRRMDATVEAMDMASRMAARVLVLALGPLPAVDAPERATLVDALASLAARGGRLGVQLAAQCPEEAPEDLAALLAALPAGLIGADLSPADVIRRGGSPRAYIGVLGPQIIHVFANDAVRGTAGGGAVDVELGRGEADVPEMLGALEEFEYRGWITVERRNSTRPVDDCADAVAFLRAL